ncbi:uncharacterized protein BDW43DRAFT_316972 [Aspergillus alliaceus]|uniref:uncharacterized protein n=1 Tax=Petromyces alliaceus TaxID=209559 RepID=UPI0012A6E826|nr:uncharacterized protein BDW43DRAFT_316972 [Aspergillus alliaceus]KAB8227286.1 hypothetical protein BDW43DRAFT_316972 [Aspergillus alliaceus]
MKNNNAKPTGKRNSGMTASTANVFYHGRTVPKGMLVAGRSEPSRASIFAVVAMFYELRSFEIYDIPLLSHAARHYEHPFYTNSAGTICPTVAYLLTASTKAFPQHSDHQWALRVLAICYTIAFSIMLVWPSIMSLVVSLVLLGAPHCIIDTIGVERAELGPQGLFFHYGLYVIGGILGGCIAAFFSDTSLSAA